MILTGEDGENSVVGLQSWVVFLCTTHKTLVCHLITEPPSDRSSHQPVSGRSATHIWLNLTTLESKWLLKWTGTCVWVNCMVNRHRIRASCLARVMCWGIPQKWNWTSAVCRSCFTEFMNKIFLKKLWKVINIIIIYKWVKRITNWQKRR